MKLPDTTSIITPAGAVSPITVPTFILSQPEAILLRDYLLWLHHRQLSAKVFCPECWDERSEPSMIDTNEQEHAIGIYCAHRLLIYSGNMPPFTREYEDDASKLWKPTDGGILLADQVPTVNMTDDESKVLRQYRRFMIDRHVKEALYCQTCWDRNLYDGCRATVSDGAIDIICRHVHLRHRGRFATH